MSSSLTRSLYSARGAQDRRLRGGQDTNLNLQLVGIHGPPTTNSLILGIRAASPGALRRSFPLHHGDHHNLRNGDHRRCSVELRASKIRVSRADFRVRAPAKCEGRPRFWCIFWPFLRYRYGDHFPEVPKSDFSVPFWV